jgi:BMFP domain-containing protein YqiC
MAVAARDENDALQARLAALEAQLGDGNPPAAAPKAPKSPKKPTGQA